MVKVHRILSRSDALFEPAWGCYCSSFPEAERRGLSVQLQAMQDARFHMDVYTDEGGFIALFFYWESNDFIYGEHLAVHPGRRGAGLGKRILTQFVTGLDKPLILEIEPLQDETCRARWRFYQQLGFHFLDVEHRQLCYRPHDEALAMHLLSYPHALTGAEVLAFQSWLQREVIV